MQEDLLRTLNLLKRFLTQDKKVTKLFIITMLSPSSSCPQHSKLKNKRRYSKILVEAV